METFDGILEHSVGENWKTIGHNKRLSTHQVTNKRSRCSLRAAYSESRSIDMVCDLTIPAPRSKVSEDRVLLGRDCIPPT